MRPLAGIGVRAAGSHGDWRPRISTSRSRRGAESVSRFRSDAERLACRRLPLLPSPMATPRRQPFTPSAVPNASDFLELYAFERPGPAVPADEFVEELKVLARAHPIDATLADALKYGGTDREALRRWIKDY